MFAKNPYKIKDYFHGDMLADIAHLCIEDYGINRDELYKLPHLDSSIIFCKPDHLRNVLQFLSVNKNKHILISHNSDYAVGFKGQKPNSIVKWYCANKAEDSNDVIGVPLSIERPRGDGYSWDISIIDETIGTAGKDNKLCYMNHSTTTETNIRPATWEWGINQSFITHESKVSFKRFLSQLWQHKFHICPPGNGVDCHHPWEAIWLGCIPICLKSVTMLEFTDLPILFVDKYEDITEKLLNKVWDEYNNREWDFSKLTFKYWAERITSDYESLCNR